MEHFQHWLRLKAPHIAGQALNFTAVFPFLKCLVMLLSARLPARQSLSKELASLRAGSGLICAYLNAQSFFSIRAAWFLRGFPRLSTAYVPGISSPSCAWARQVGPGLDQSPSDAGLAFMQALNRLHALAAMGRTLRPPRDLHTWDLLRGKQGEGCI